MSNKCQYCEAEACFKIVSIDVDGCVQEAFLCKKHAKEKGILEQGAYQFLENISAKNCGIALSKHICPYCGCSKEWVEKTKRMGCPHCYDIFSDFVKQSVHHFKNNDIHLGKIPRWLRNPKKVLTRLYAPRLHFFETRMEAFVKAENFEGAQEYRKNIKKILKEMENAPINI